MPRPPQPPIQVGVIVCDIRFVIVFWYFGIIVLTCHVMLCLTLWYVSVATSWLPEAQCQDRFVEHALRPVDGCGTSPGVVPYHEVLRQVVRCTIVRCHVGSLTVRPGTFGKIKDGVPKSPSVKKHKQ